MQEILGIRMVFFLPELGIRTKLSKIRRKVAQYRFILVTIWSFFPKVTKNGSIKKVKINLN